MSKIQKVQLTFLLPCTLSSMPLLAKFLHEDLSRWYCDDIGSGKSEGEYIFSWKGRDAAESNEEILYLRNDDELCVSYYKYCDETGGKSKNYFELKIDYNELTKNVFMIVTELVQEDEAKECEEFWEEQIKKLQKLLGI